MLSLTNSWSIDPILVFKSSSLALVLLIIGQLVANRYFTGLNRFPGPFLAGFSDLWRASNSYFGSYKEPMMDLHAKYGDVVRMGPRVLYFRQPEAIRDIYITANFRKSNYYYTQSPVNQGNITSTLFSSIDPVWHDSLRKTINGAFLPAAVVQYEHLVDSTIDTFLSELDKRFAEKPGSAGSIDFHPWLFVCLYYAFDVMGDIAYSQRHGFIEGGRDVNGIIGYVKTFLGFGFISGQIPSMNILFRHNPILLWLERLGWFHGSTFPGATLAVQRMIERKEQYEAGKVKKESERQDLLDTFLRAQKENPGKVSDREVLGLSLSMIIAGAETSAITLTALFYFLLRNPTCYEKLQQEIGTLLPPKDSNQEFYKAEYAKIKTLPYLHACIQETFRLHPAFAFNFERVVGPNQHIICDQTVPPGTIVGCNPWVIHRDKAIYGFDSDVFRPERWIENPEKTRVMDRTMFQFGSGKFMCLGKNIALLEIYKFVPSFVRTFKVTMEQPERPWKVFNGANLSMSDFEIRIERRG